MPEEKNLSNDAAIEHELPYISALVVTRNEKDFIEKCLLSLLNQTYPNNCYEIIIVDGMSTDGTKQIIQNTLNDYNRVHNEKEAIKFSIYDNPKKILASGWNIAVKQAIGKYVVRIDAHAYVDHDFLHKSVLVMMNVKDASCVGGAMQTISDNKTGKIITEALTSPFGVGGAKFRYMNSSGYVDTVAYGLYSKSVFDQIGYFNEGLVRTQDNDLHRRMRDAGMKFYYDPEIKSYYYSRNTLKKLCQQQFQNGKWTMINFRSRPGKMSLRHFIPFCFVMTVITLMLLGVIYPLFRVPVVSVILTHLICGLVFAIKRTRIMSHIVKLPIIFMLIHICYGIGSICGLFHKTV